MRMSKPTSGCVLPELADHAGQKPRRQRLAGDQAHAAAAQALQFLDLRAHTLQVGGAATDVAHEQLAGRGQAHAARQSLEYRRAELVLDVLDPAVHRRGRHVQPLGRLADRADAGHFVDVAQKSQMVHATYHATIVPLYESLPFRQRNKRDKATNRRTFGHVACMARA